MPPSSPFFDLELSERDVLDLTGPDAVAGFFARLGYRTEARIEQTPANLGIRSEEMLRDLRSIQLVAEQEDGFQVYLLELRTVKIAHRQHLARAFRDRAGIFLFVLTTSDYDRLDFLFLESYLPQTQEDILPGLPQSLLRHKLRPRVLTLERRKPKKVQLRVLRRFTWTEPDGYAQRDKIVAAFGIADWSEDYFNNRALFSDYYLLNRLRDEERPEWEEDPKPAYRRLRQIYREATTRIFAKEISSLAGLLAGFLGPALSALGFTFEPGATRESDRQPVPPKDLSGLPLYAPGGKSPLARCLAFPWGRSLDAKDSERDPETADVNPGIIVVSVLERGDVPWVILTNGRLWRLYARHAHSRATNYYEIDLGEVLDATGLLAADPTDSFRYFWLLFRREAFELRPIPRKGQTLPESLLDELLAESQAFARRLGDSLKDQVFERVFPDLAAGFAADLRQSRAGGELSQEDLDRVFRGTLTFLYRLLFLLYAEARDLLPVREVRGYYQVSLTRLREEIGEAAGPSVTDSSREIGKRYREDSFLLYDRLSRLFQIIDQGDLEANVPKYNGGLFLSEPHEDDTAPEAEAARFLLATRVADAPLARAIDCLARDEDEKRKELVAIDYKSLGVRQLGSIYEGLLEFRLRVASQEMAIVEGKAKGKGKKSELVVPLSEARDKGLKILKEGRGKEAKERLLLRGAFYLENDKRERKATGSYYTPDFVVEYIVAKTVGPILEEKLEALRSKLREAEQWHRKAIRLAEAKGERVSKYELGPAVEKEWAGLIRQAFDLKVLDPAMGSGHFLVEAVDFVTDGLLDFLSAFPWNPVFAHLAGLRKDILDDMDRQGIAIDERKLTDVNLLKRHVLKRCVFGVDLNPMAVELAKLSLWLDCFTLGAPLSFLDHHLRCGNSLLGVTVKEVEDVVTLTLFGGRFTGLMLATKLMADVGEMPDVTREQIRESRERFQEAANALSPYIRVLDIYATRWFSEPAKGKKKSEGRLLEIDFLKAPETDLFLSSETEADARHSLAALPPADWTFAQAALAKAASLKFFHWELGFPEVFYGSKPGAERAVGRLEHGGFDAVIGNPPWVRQEGLKEMKAALTEIFFSIYDPEADIYTYLLGRGIQVLRPGGRLGMILQNKWFKAEYAEKLRSYLIKDTRVIEVINFGHAPLFDADTFPCLLLLQRPTAPDWQAEEDGGVDFFDVNRADLSGIDLHEYGKQRQSRVSVQRLRPEGWELLSKESGDLMEKIRKAGVPLREYLGNRIYRGVLTGLNQAFLIDQEVRDQLVQEDRSCESVIKKFLRGESIRRWHSPWGGEWIILLKSSQGHEWPWSQFKDEVTAEASFRDAYPSLYARMKIFEERLRKRQDQGKFWWELRACDYYEEFEGPKILYQDIGFHSSFSLDLDNQLSNNTCYFVPNGSPILLAILNSSLMWWFLGNITQRGKDDAFRLHTIYMERLPVPFVSDAVGGAFSERIEAVSSAIKILEGKTDDFIARLRERLDGSSVPSNLQDPWRLNETTFLGNVRKARLGAGPLFEKNLTDDFSHVRRSVRQILAEIRRIEIELHVIVFDLYGLTPEEVQLVKETAPARDPLLLAVQNLEELGQD